MSAPYSVTTTILTEHMGFPPISLVDDIINCVNEVMYKCTAALEKYLHSKENEILQDDNSEDLNEVEVGTAKLETLFESSIDKNFDLFELYTLRNIMNIPNELVKEGFFKLDHYKHIRKVPNLSKKLQEIDSKIERLEKKLNFELLIKPEIIKFLQRAKSLQTYLAKFKLTISLLLGYIDEENQVSDEKLKDSLKTLAPLKDSVLFIQNEYKEICSILKKLTEKLPLDSEDKLLEKFATTNKDRNTYIDTKSYKLLKLYNVINDHDDHIKTDNDMQLLDVGDLQIVRKSQEDISNLKRVNENILIADYS